MKSLKSIIIFITTTFIFLSSVVLANAPKNLKNVFINRIEGRVYDPEKNFLPDADIELLNDTYSILSHTKTNSSGQFSFTGISTGKFVIKATAYRLNLRPETQEVEIAPARASASITEYVDIYMHYDKEVDKTMALTSPDAIFVQEIPQKAKELYQKGLKQLSKKSDDALIIFEEAIQIFPTYFDALFILGKEYIARQKYEKGYPYLLKAIDINPRSSASYYSLAYAFWQLKEIPAALEAAKATVLLNQSIVESQKLYGTILRINGNYEESEKALLKAKLLAKKADPEIHWQLALLYNKLNRNQDAAKELEDYLKADPNSPDKKKIEEMIKKLRNSK